MRQQKVTRTKQGGGDGVSVSRQLRWFADIFAAIFRKYKVCSEVVSIYIPLSHLLPIL